MKYLKNTPHPTTPDAREQARLRSEDYATRAEARITNAERFGWPHEQAEDRAANIASLPPEVQASIRAEYAKLFYDVRIMGCATSLPVRSVFFDKHTNRLTVGVDLPPGYGRKHDLAAFAAKPTEEEPHTIIGQGATARHLST